jgi:hypothetical protein
MNLAMTAELLLEKSLRFDRSGKPLEVVIPYEQFIDFIEEHGLSARNPDTEGPDAEELEAMLEAEADRAAGNHQAFISLADLKVKLGI